ALPPVMAPPGGRPWPAVVPPAGRDPRLPDGALSRALLRRVGDRARPRHRPAGRVGQARQSRRRAPAAGVRLIVRRPPPGASLGRSSEADVPRTERPADRGVRRFGPGGRLRDPGPHGLLLPVNRREPALAT